MIRIMFVCHGNICRSTMAEFVMKDMVKKAGVADKFYIASAATSRDEIGSDTHYGTKNKLTKQNIPFTKRAAVQLCQKDYDNFDYIIGMDSANIRNILRITGGDSEGKVYKMLCFCGRNDDVADPWYTGDFDKTYEDVCDGCEALLKKLCEERI